MEEVKVLVMEKWEFQYEISKNKCQILVALENQD